MYGNAQKPDLQGGAAWFLGTKYYSEGSQFAGPLVVREAVFNYSTKFGRFPSCRPGVQGLKGIVLPGSTVAMEEQDLSILLKLVPTSQSESSHYKCAVQILAGSVLFGGW